MQFFKLSAVLFAATVVAEHNHGMQQFHHRRQMNATSSDISTTLTVYQTVVHTITSCAPTITNCPARSSAGAGVITDVIVLTTTVCPVTAAESIASSIISAAGGSSSVFTGTPSSTVVGIPLSTGLAGVRASGASVTNKGNGVSSSSETVLTYTLGAGSSITIVTTTIKHTSTATAYITQYMTRSQSSPTVATGESGTQTGATGTQTRAASTQAGVAGVGSQSGPTTTITSSSTMTKYVTVKVAPSSSGISTKTGASGASGSAGGCESCNCAPVTVTVALATVTVTYSPMGASPTATQSLVASAKAIQVSAASSSNASPDTTAQGISSHTPGSIISSSKGPYGNGTVTTTKPCNGSGTGFLTLAKPTETMSAYY